MTSLRLHRNTRITDAAQIAAEHGYDLICHDARLHIRPIAHNNIGRVKTPSYKNQFGKTEVRP